MDDKDNTLCDLKDEFRKVMLVICFEREGTDKFRAALFSGVLLTQCFQQMAPQKDLAGGKQRKHLLSLDKKFSSKLQLKLSLVPLDDHKAKIVEE